MLRFSLSSSLHRERRVEAHSPVDAGECECALLSNLHAIAPPWEPCTLPVLSESEMRWRKSCGLSLCLKFARTSAIRNGAPISRLDNENASRRLFASRGKRKISLHNLYFFFLCVPSRGCTQIANLSRVVWEVGDLECWGYTLARVVWVSVVVEALASPQFCVPWLVVGLKRESCSAVSRESHFNSIATVCSCGVLFGYILSLRHLYLLVLCTLFSPPKKLVNAPRTVAFQSCESRVVS